jgi:hypothetical protein
MPTDLTKELHQGYDAGEWAEAPFLATSPSWLAWLLGRYMAQRHILKPLAVTTSRGDAIRTDSVVWMPISPSRTLWRRK